MTLPARSRFLIYLHGMSSMTASAGAFGLHYDLAGRMLLGWGWFVFGTTFGILCSERGWLRFDHKR